MQQYNQQKKAKAPGVSTDNPSEHQGVKDESLQLEEMFEATDSNETGIRNQETTLRTLQPILPKPTKVAKKTTNLRLNEKRTGKLQLCETGKHKKVICREHCPDINSWCPHFNGASWRDLVRRPPPLPPDKTLPFGSAKLLTKEPEIQRKIM